MRRSGTKMILTPVDPALRFQSRESINAARAAAGKAEVSSGGETIELP